MFWDIHSSFEARVVRGRSIRRHRPKYPPAGPKSVSKKVFSVSVSVSPVLRR
jgi:hypothetical protein